ncbi:MAG: hypothetical protein HY791_14130 [Deltaproteobacteria bacterium]|nr:hypothetical protein [Deltaproteobacteria bacterium]
MKWTATFAIAMSLVAGEASAQLLSPGKLARPHADLEGLRSCTKCHEAGSKLGEKLCLDCHTELRARVEQKRGYHGRLEDRTCHKCHPDHRGEDFEMVIFGPRGEKGFDHRLSGYALDGAHAKVSCEECHDSRLVAAADVRALMKKHRKAKTYLGLSADCSSCHFDEHRGQLGQDCKSCHSTRTFQIERFDHGLSRYELSGAHVKVACDKCHEAKTGTEPAATFPKPKSLSFVTYKPLEFDRCTSCHQDPHTGRFGADCSRCHDTTNWSRTRLDSPDKVAFHDRTRYPLVGLHRSVACESCHGPKRAPKWKGVAFDRCDRCHLDAHRGELPGDCEPCHDLRGFVPSTFEREAHDDTPYPLRGGHAAAACAACHAKAESAELMKPPKGRALLVSNRRFRFDREDDCSSCHADPHQQELAPKACTECHVVDSFTILSFDHDAESSYPLTGKHRGLSEAQPIPCGRCHASADGRVSYRGTPKECRDCHTDVHAGQLDAPPSDLECDENCARLGCSRCHDTNGFKTTAFRHDPEFTTYSLDGSHATVDCGGCHLKRETPHPTIYRGLPRTCAGCHVDPHDGRMRRFEQP